jgi:signal transduction histidine kinase
MFARWLKYLDTLPPRVVVALLAAMTLGIGAVDYFASTDATFSAAYLIPIGMAAWFLGGISAYVFAILSSIIWVAGDFAAGAHYTSPLLPLWNVGSRFAVFILAVQLIVELRRLHRGLEARVEERAGQLTTALAARERLERELLHISDREQRRVGHDIHDSLCQHLTGTALAGQVLAENLKSRGMREARDADRVVALIEEGISLSRNLAKGLNSVRLSTDGLMEALEDFASSTSDLFNLSCRFECPLPILINNTDTAEHLYRIAQEAVSNAIKHGHAKNIVIRLDSSATSKLLRVIDDGSGLPAQHMNGKGMGLRIMSYRAQFIGAKLSIRRRDAGGTVLACLLPIASQKEAAKSETTQIWELPV